MQSLQNGSEGRYSQQKFIMAFLIVGVLFFAGKCYFLSGQLRDTQKELTLSQKQAQVGKLLSAEYQQNYKEFTRQIRDLQSQKGQTPVAAYMADKSQVRTAFHSRKMGLTSQDSTERVSKISLLTPVVYEPRGHIIHKKHDKTGTGVFFTTQQGKYIEWHGAYSWDSDMPRPRP